MKSEKFDDWFAQYLGQDPDQVSILLRDKTAIRFLIAWSLFETSCFDGFATIEGISIFSECNSKQAPVFIAQLQEHIQFFHNRYQDNRLYKNLMYRQKSNRMERILSSSVASLSDSDKVFFSIFVVYRYRNNIFHGNKGVSSWLAYREYIQRCIVIMQIFIPSSLVLGSQESFR